METETPEIRIARLEERLKARDEALGLQAAEYERRLALLNHAHEAAQQRDSLFVSTERYDAHESDLAKWRNSIDVEIGAMKGKIAGYSGALAFVFCIAQILIHFWGKS